MITKTFEKPCPFCKENHLVEYQGTLLVARLDGKMPNQYKCMRGPKSRLFTLAEDSAPRKQDPSECMLELIENITQLKIGDEICTEERKFPYFVVGLLAEAGTLGFLPANHTGTIYADFQDNEGDVIELHLKDEHICKIHRNA